METPEGRAYHEISDRKTYVEMRKSLFGKQSELQEKARVGIATVSRLERTPGWRVLQKVAERIQVAFEQRAREKGKLPVGAFPALFKAADPQPSKAPSYSWRQITAAAEKVGKFTKDFQPDAIVTFSGHSSLFASLVLVRSFQEDELLNMPVYLAQQRKWKRSSRSGDPPRLLGFTTHEGDGIAVLMPEALAQLAEADPERKKKFVVLDDSITSGVVPPVVREYFGETLRYPPENIKIACGVYYDVVLRARAPDCWAIKTKSKSFRMPWGPQLYFGELD
jgi:hypothetical protein